MQTTSRVFACTKTRTSDRSRRPGTSRRSVARPLSGALVSASVVLLAFAHATAQTLRPTIVDDHERLYPFAMALDDAGGTAFAIVDTNDFGDNERRNWQLVSFDASSAADAGITAFRDGVTGARGGVSVSDDGQWLAFVSSGNPVGANHDESVELFVIDASGNDLVQLTDTPGLDAGPVGSFMISGDGTRVAFWSAEDPLGTDPAKLGKIYVVDRDGANLEEVAATGDAVELSLSDDATRLTFQSRYDPLATNGDGSLEVFAIRSDGTGVRQVTDLASGAGEVGSPRLSGDGSRIVWIGTDDPLARNPSNFPQVFTDVWAGGSLAQPTPGSAFVGSPSIQDDGSRIFFHGSMDEGQNPDGNSEIWRVLPDGTALTALTSTAPPLSNRDPTVSGGGDRVVFKVDGGAFAGGVNPDGGDEWMAMDGSGGSLVQLTRLEVSSPLLGPIAPELTPDGSRIVFLNVDQRLYVADADGGNPQALTPPMEFTTDLSANDQTVALSSIGDPLGANPFFLTQIFAVELDGSGLRQLTDGLGVWTQPALAADGSWIVFQGVGGLYRIRPDGSDFSLVTTDASGLFKWPAISGNGEWATFQSDSGGSVTVIRTNTMLGGKTTIGGGTNGDVTNDGQNVVFRSGVDGNCHLWNQLTGSTALTTSGACLTPRITDDGAFVFYEDAPEHFDGTDPFAPRAYRLEVATGEVERLSGVATRGARLANGNFEQRHGEISFDASGRRILFGGTGDWDGNRPRGGGGTMLVDLDGPNPIRVSSDSPTVVSWIAVPASRRYDVIRGDVANLQAGGGVSDLGPVVCVEDDSPDPDTVGDEDAGIPAPGHVFFYLFRGTQGVGDGPGTYGVDSGGLERVPSSGDCGI